MNILNVVIGNKFLASSLCFVGGYALNSASIAINRFAVKYLRLPMDLFDGQDYETYTTKIVEQNRQYTSLHGIGLDRQLAALLSDFTIQFAIREEISYRFLLETVVLPCISPQFAVFSMARTCVSSLLFASFHLHNPLSREALTGQFFNTALLGVICSLAQQRMGLIGAVFVHVGYNLHGWQYMYNQNLTEVVKKIRALHLIDVIHPIKVFTFLSHFIDDALSPFVLTYRAIKKIVAPQPSQLVT